MLTLDDLTVESFNIDELTLTWTWRTTAESVSDYIIDVYRSTAPLTPPTQYDLILSGINADDYGADDHTISGLYHPHRTWYYSLYVYPSGLQASGIYTDYSYFHLDRDLYAKYMIRSMVRGTSRYGKSIGILKKRSSGTRCPTCWDPTLQRTIRSTCERCYDTGFDGGYYEPINTWGVINAKVKRNEITPFGEWIPGDCLFNYAGYPRLAERDILIDERNRRWRVKQVIPVEYKQFLISQRARIEQVDLGDIIYQYPITVISGQYWKDVRLKLG